MSGFVAIIAHDHRERVREEEVSEMAAIYASLRGEVKHYLASASTYGQVIKIDTAAADRPGIERSGASWAAVTGALRHRGSVMGLDLDDMEGQFGLISYDAELDELRVISDPFGLQALYEAERDGKTYISTSALTLAKYLRARPDPLGVELFLRTGYQIGGVTHWEGVRRVEPATCIVFSPAGVERRAYWRPVLDERVARLTFEETRDHCLEVLTQTYRCQYSNRPRVWADLTGGYDTRLTTLVMQRAGVDFCSYTSGEEQSNDVRIAREIIRTTGWNWRHFYLPENWAAALPSLLSTSLAWADGTLEVLQLSAVLWQHAEKARDFRRLLMGGGHEHFRGHVWRQEFLNAGKSTKVNFENLLTMAWLAPADTTIFARDPTDAVREYLHASAVRWTEPYADTLNTTQLDILHLHKMTGHFGAYGPAAGAFLCVDAPFYTRPVCTAAISANYRYRDRHRLMRHMLARLDPRVAAIVTTSGGTAEPYRLDNLHRILPYYTRIAQRALYKLGGQVPAISRLVPRRGPSPLALAGLPAALNGLQLQPATMRSASLFKPDALDLFLKSAYAPSFRGVGLLGRIITVELALKETNSEL